MKLFSKLLFIFTGVILMGGTLVYAYPPPSGTNSYYDSPRYSSTNALADMGLAGNFIIYTSSLNHAPIMILGSTQGFILNGNMSISGYLKLNDGTTVGARLTGLDNSTSSLQSQINSFIGSTATANIRIDVLEADTATIVMSLNIIDAKLLNLNSSTNSISNDILYLNYSTAVLTSRINDLNNSTNSINSLTSTHTLRLNNLDNSTNSINISLLYLNYSTSILTNRLNILDSSTNSIINILSTQSVRLNNLDNSTNSINNSFLYVSFSTNILNNRLNQLDISTANLSVQISTINIRLNSLDLSTNALNINLASSTIYSTSRLNALAISTTITQSHLVSLDASTTALNSRIDTVQPIYVSNALYNLVISTNLLTLRIDNLDSSTATLRNNINSTYTALQNNINSLYGNVSSTYTTLIAAINSTNTALQGNINNVYINTQSTYSALNTAINSTYTALTNNYTSAINSTFTGLTNNYASAINSTFTSLTNNYISAINSTQSVLFNQINSTWTNLNQRVTGWELFTATFTGTGGGGGGGAVGIYQDSTFKVSATSITFSGASVSFENTMATITITASGGSGVNYDTIVIGTSSTGLNYSVNIASNTQYAFQTAISSLGANGGNIKVRRGIYTFISGLGDVSIPKNVTIDFEDGAIVHTNGNQDLFICSGTIKNLTIQFNGYWNGKYGVWMQPLGKVYKLKYSGTFGMSNVANEWAPLTFSYSTGAVVYDINFSSMNSNQAANNTKIVSFKNSSSSYIDGGTWDSYVSGQADLNMEGYYSGIKNITFTGQMAGIIQWTNMTYSTGVFVDNCKFLFYETGGVNIFSGGASAPYSVCRFTFRNCIFRNYAVNSGMNILNFGNNCNNSQIIGNHFENVGTAILINGVANNLFFMHGNTGYNNTTLISDGGAGTKIRDNISNGSYVADN